MKGLLFLFFLFLFPFFFYLTLSKVILRNSVCEIYRGKLSHMRASQYHQAFKWVNLENIALLTSTCSGKLWTQKSAVTVNNSERRGCLRAQEITIVSCRRRFASLRSIGLEWSCEKFICGLLRGILLRLSLFSISKNAQSLTSVERWAANSDCSIQNWAAICKIGGFSPPANNLPDNDSGSHVVGHEATAPMTWLLQRDRNFEVFGPSAGRVA